MNGGNFFDECRRILLPVKHSGIESKVSGEVSGGAEPRADVIAAPSFLLADGFATGPRRRFNLLIRYRLARRAAAASIKAARPREAARKEGKQRNNERWRRRCRKMKVADRDR